MASNVGRSPPWLVNGRPLCFWLTGFFNPQGFLTANRQEVCRKHAKDQWALDDVVNHTEVLRHERDEVRKGPDEGIYIYGLFLEGCRWDKAGNRLADSEPKVAPPARTSSHNHTRPRTPIHALAR